MILDHSPPEMVRKILIAPVTSGGASERLFRKAA